MRPLATRATPHAVQCGGRWGSGRRRQPASQGQAVWGWRLAWGEGGGLTYRPREAVTGVGKWVGFSPHPSTSMNRSFLPLFSHLFWVVDVPFCVGKPTKIPGECTSHPHIATVPVVISMDTLSTAIGLLVFGQNKYCPLSLSGLQQCRPISPGFTGPAVARPLSTVKESGGQNPKPQEFCSQINRGFSDVGTSLYAHDIYSAIHEPFGVCKIGLKASAGLKSLVTSAAFKGGLKWSLD